MIPAISLLAVISAVASAAGSADQCCVQRRVNSVDVRGGIYSLDVNLTLIAKTSSASLCSNNCIYTADGKPGQFFCFGPGSLTSECSTPAIGPKGPEFTAIMIGGSYDTETVGYPCNTSIENFPIKTSNLKAVVFKDEILVCGGFNENGASNECYTEKATKWIQTSNMTIPRQDFTMSSFKDIVIVTGGKALREVYDTMIMETLTIEIHSNEIEIFNGTTWTKLNNTLTSPRYYHCAVVISDTEFYVLGGKNGDIILPIMEKYDNKGNLVAGNIQNMTAPRFDFGCTMMEGKIYAAGGQQMDTSGSTIEIYDPSLNTWNLMKAKFEHNMMGFHLTVLNGNLTLLGQETLSYNAESQNWTQEANIRYNDYFALVVVPCNQN